MQALRARTALVHDFLLDVRGAERVFAALCDMFPQADVFTAVYDEQGTEGRFAHRNINTSFLQRLRPTASTFRALLPLYPYAVEALDLRGYDLVISSSSAWAHGVIVDDPAVHICYCHNPFRYAWNARETALAGRSSITCAALGMILQRWRQWDWIAAQRVDRYIANSETTRRRISRYFNRESTVVYPPVEMERFSTAPVGDYYLVLSELMPHKRIAAVEAQAAGRPVIALSEGGVRETVRDGITGAFYDRADSAALIEVLSTFDPFAFDSQLCIANAARFDVSHFSVGVSAIVAEACSSERRARDRRRQTRRMHGLAPLRPYVEG